MKIIFYTSVFLFLLSFCTNMRAQKEELPETLFEGNWQQVQKRSQNVPRHSIDMGIHLALPQGTFGGTTLDERSGYAGTGFGFQVAASYQTRKHWGLGGLLQWTQNPLQQMAYLADLSERLPNGTLSAAINETSNNNTNTNTAKAWQQALLAVGTCFSFAETNLILDLRLMVGASMLQLPAYYYELPLQNDIFTDSRTANKNIRPAFVMGVSIHRPLGKHWAVGVHANYIGTSTAIDVVQTISAPNYWLQTRNKGVLGVHQVCLSAGMRYQLGYAR